MIDEVHNIRISDDSPNKKTAKNLLTLVKQADNLRLLLLSATPMFNNYTEIVWLINLLNINDNRSTVQIRDIFDAEGNFKISPDGEEIGKELFVRKITGYVSYLSGENPYTFPYRIFPKLFAERENQLINFQYPKYQINGSAIFQDIQHLDIYSTVIGSYQQIGYSYIIEKLKDRIPKKTDIESGLGYQMLDSPLQALNMVYPIKELDHNTFIPSAKPAMDEVAMDEAAMDEAAMDEAAMDEASQQTIKTRTKTGKKITLKPSILAQDTNTPQQSPVIQDLTMGGTKTTGELSRENTTNIDFDVKDLVGKIGLARSMYFNEKKKNEFRYKEKTEDSFGKIFSPEQLPKYSSKISSICETIKKSKGISLIYSQFIDGGCVPVALALEQMGITRYQGSKRGSLFKTPPVEGIDALTMKPRSKSGDNFQQASYVMITGDKLLSPNNVIDLKAVTNENNLDGSKVKVVIISKAGSEGLDFSNLRQVHILEPWYNMNRIEQIIGRAVRFCSHKQLPFSERNVEIYLYGTILDGTEEESADLYVYRLAENKSVKIGNVTRILKETAIDCVLNDKLNMLTEEKMSQTVSLQLASGKMIKYNVGYKPYSSICDYMESCSYKCQPDFEITDSNISDSSYHEDFINVNIEKIMLRIRNLFRERYIYTKDDLIKEINAVKQYPVSQIYAALDRLVTDKTEFVTDILDRNGKIVNIDNYYMFQPIEIQDTTITHFERSVPVDFKRESVRLSYPKDFTSGDDASKFVEKQTKQLSLVKPIKDKSKKQTVSIKSDVEVDPITKIQSFAITYIKEIQDNLELVNNPFTPIRGENSWYRQCSLTRERLEEDGIDRATFMELLIDHIFDSLPFSKKFILISYLMNYQDDDKLVKRLKDKVLQDVLTADSVMGYIFIEKGDANLYVFKDSKFVKAEITDISDFKKQITKNIIVNKENININNIIGFYSTFKSDTMIFKTKSISLKTERNKGARCDQAGKATVVKTLNKIFQDNERYTKETLGRENNVLQLCSEQEMYLRYFDRIKKDGKRWFFTPSEFALSNI